MASSGKQQWYVGEDGCIPIGEPANSVTYHSSLNSIIVATDEPAIKIYDVTSGSVLQKSDLSAPKGEKIGCMYLQNKNKMVFTSSTALGVRSDLHGVLLLDTALQTPVAKTEDKIRLELPVAEASQFMKSLTSADLSCVEHTELVVKEMERQIEAAHEATKGNHKTTKWATVCIEVPHCALKAVSSTLVSEMRRVNVHSPGLSIASAVSDRLGYLLPSNQDQPSGGTVDRALMYSEAARRETFTKWPHMNYKWALPDPMAQAGFYHQPNVSGDDRAMCFTCNVCLVCWEPTDEPWSEHERHSPSCPFVKGEHTQNVPLSVTYATQPALLHSDGNDKIECVSSTDSEDYIATSTKHGAIVVWNLKRKMKKYCQFVLDPTETTVALKTGVQVERKVEVNSPVSKPDPPLEGVLDTSQDLTDKQGAESLQEDQVDAKAFPDASEGPVIFSVGDNGAKDDSLHEIPLHETPIDINDISASFTRPNEDIIVTSMCLVEKPEVENIGTHSHSPRKNLSKKSSNSPKVRKRQIQPSLICGVSLRRSKLPLNCNEEGQDSDVQTEVQIMNKVNEVVSSGDTSPHIITNSDGVNDDQMSSEDDILGSTSFMPYILVVSVSEDTKVLKEMSSDSLAPTLSSGNIVPTLGSITMNQQDWNLLDHMYDSDPDVQIVKVTPGPASLSTSSPTEGGTKQDDLGQEGVNLNQGGQKTSSTSVPESAIKRLATERAGSVLQCIELPQEVQSDNLRVSSICPTLDRQHLVVVLSPKSQCVSQSQFKSSVLSSSNSTNSKCTSTSAEEECSESVSSSSNSDALLVTYSGSGLELGFKTNSSSSQSTGNTNNSLDDSNTNSSSVTKSDHLSSNLNSNGYILVYKFSYDCDNYYASIEEKPIVIRSVTETERGIEKVLVLPREVSEQVEEDDLLTCDDDLLVPTSSLMSVSSGKQSGLYGQMAVIYRSGKMGVLNSSDLAVLATVDPPGRDRFVDVTYCSGIDRLCLCSSQGKLYFYQLSEETPDQSDSLVDGEMTPNTEIPDVFLSDTAYKSEEVLEHSPRSTVSEVLAKQQLTFESLSQLHNLIQFENLMPRFTATVPPCWSEIQQEQQQRRHPQHLQHQGEATQHTRSWKLQPDSTTWDEHLFEIVLPRVCCVGHVDVKFTFNSLCGSTPKIQVTLLKQNINAIGRQSNPGPDATSTPVDSKINFNIKQSSYNSDESDSSGSSGSRSSSVINNVQDPQFLEMHNAEILCGPINISECLDLSGNSGLVSLTSPQLLMSKPRSFLLHIKGFPSKTKEHSSDKSKEMKKKRTAAQASDKNRAKTIKALFENIPIPLSSSSKSKVANLKGCDWLTELSVTIRKTKKSNLPKERMQRNAMVELTSFHEKLLSTVSFDEGFLMSGVSPDHVQNMCLDMIIWITNIQMHDPDLRSPNKSILTNIQHRLQKITQACYIQGTRTTAHKCSRLLSVCMECSKSSLDPDLAPSFSMRLLEALVDCLPLLPCAYSAGALKWYFTLLNRVKCMDVVSVSSQCSELLSNLSKHFHERASPLHALIKARYGLNGHPFEADLFDMELPKAVKQIIPGSQPSSSFTNTMGTTTTTTTSGSSTITSTATQQQQQQQQDELDFYMMFNNPPEKKSLLETARNQILGMLEVEPLHFTCHSTSDGTKMERLDNTSSIGGTTVINPAGLGTSGLGNSSLSGTINFGESLPQTAYGHSQMPSTLPYSLPQTVAAAKHQLQELSTKNYTSVKHKIMHIKQILYEVGKNTPLSTQKTPSGSSELMPSTPKTTPQVMTPPLTPPNEGWQQIFLQGEKSDMPKSSRASVSVQQPHALLQPPPPQVLVVERFYSGARRFVILDFGKPILLTDVIIPLCGDLASLSIDVWVQGEDVDGQRLVVASDIGFQSLVMNNIMPPPVCRFLKITTIGRYGSGTTRSKIPIGAFYGHSYILPWEWNTRPDHYQSPSTSSVACQLDFPTQSQLLSNLGSFMSLLEDIQCRYSLSRARLESLLVQVESLQYANLHTQYYLKKSKNNDEDNNILLAYNDCLQLQLQQNLAMRAIDRLQSAIGLRLPITKYPSNPTTMLKQATTDKLRFLLENLLETLISITNHSPSIPQPPVSLYTSLNHAMCQNLFKHLCFQGTPRVQILTGMMLVRVCGGQSWFGNFLGNTLQEYFHSETVHVFSQDRVFILLTAMGQRSLQGPCSVNIMESLLSMLARVLSPMLAGQGGRVMPHAGQLDLTLIGWILLFLCRNLDNTLMANGNGEEEGATSASAKKDQGSNLSNRWNFIQANGNVRSQMGKSRSVRLYRKSLQKRLLHHKQKLMDLEHVKKNFMAQDPSNHTLLKHQEKQFRKELSQYASKHLKDIIQIRKNDAEVLRKMPRDQRFAEDKDNLEYDSDAILVLPKEKCLPVVHGLMALLLGMDFTCNVDLFLVTCKVLARVCIATRPAITLTEAMSQEQLETLIMLAANLEFNHGNISWGGPWAGHALTCLLQDILEGERAYPSAQYEGVTDDDISNQVNETDDSTLPSSVSLPTFDMSTELNDNTEPPINQSKDDTTKLNFDKESSLMVDLLLDGYDDEPPDTPEQLHAYVTGENIQPPISTGTSAASNVMYVVPMPTSSMNGPLDISKSPTIPTMPDIEVDKLKTNKENLSMKTIKCVFGSTGYGSTGYAGYGKLPLIDTKPIHNTSNTVQSSASSQGLSTALDARLELGLETQSELRLRVMLSLQSDTLQGAFTSQLPMPPVEVRRNGVTRSTPTDDELMDSQSGMPQMTSFDMLSKAYNDLFNQLLLQRVNMDSLLQLWLTLNEEPSVEGSDNTQSTFDPCRAPIIPLSVNSVTNLLTSVAAQPSLPVRTWVLVFQSLTLCANLRIGGEDPGIDRSMVVAIMGDSNLVPIITKFLSGTTSSGMGMSHESNSQVGPSAVKAFHLFLQRLRICICGDDDIHNLKEIMLKLVYTLTAERGAFHSCLGPLDAQCKFLDFILELTYEHVDINNAISVIESVSALVHRHILCQERVYCKSTSDNGINARSCFGGLFASLLRGTDSNSRNGDTSRDSLMCNLLKLVNALLQVQFPARFSRRVSVSADNVSEPLTPTNISMSEPMTDSTKLSHALATSTPHASSRIVIPSHEERVVQESVPIHIACQTDEQKTESANQERAGSVPTNPAPPPENPGINLADIILGRQTIMCNFIQALSYCNSNTMAMILGSSGMPSNVQNSFTGGDPLSVGDGVYQILITLSRKCDDSRLLMDSLFLYLSGGFMSYGSPSLCRLSEPLLWFMLKVLDSAKMLKLFLDKGGVEVVCRNFVNCNSRIISTAPSLISTIMQNMNGKGGNDKKKKWEVEAVDGLQNFAPLGTIISCSPTASPAEVLIVAAPQHRRARSAPWSYHFYPDEAWVDLKISLPFAVLLKEVQIQPHSPALSTCPAFVSLEASQDGVTTFPLCAPMSTGSLVFIRLHLQRPEVVTSVTIRLHKARDSMTIGLSQIQLMGYSAFGEVGYKTHNLFLPTEDFVSRSSVGWIRLLHHCLVSQKEMGGLVSESAAPTPGLLNTCTALLVSPISSVYSPTIEAVLLKLGLHSGDMGLALIDNILRSSNSQSDTEYSSQYLGRMSGVANDSTVEILYQLGTVQDTWTSNRVQAMLQWLGDSARVALQRKAGYTDDGYRPLQHHMSHMTLPGPAPSHVHCIAALLWQSKEISVEYNLNHLITKDLVSSLYEWSSVFTGDSHLKKAVDYVLCSMLYICPDAFTRIMEWMGIVTPPEFGLTASISDDRKDSAQYQSSMTDDSKEASNALGQSIESTEIPPSIILQEFKHMCLDQTHLSTLALACKSPQATQQLLESGFPAVLAQGLFEFCNRVISTFADSWSQPEGISDSCKSMNGNTTGDNNNTANHNPGLSVTADMVAAVLNFFSEVCTRPAMKDWLGGADGNIFWPVLLTMLCNTPLHSPISATAFPQKFELISTEERSAIETASVTFFSSVISCHIPNQMLFAKVLFDVIKEQGSASKAGLGICPLSGFTRRLFLQVLLEDEKILVAFRAAPQQYRIHIPSSASQIQHPHFGAGRRFRSVPVNMHTTLGELINKVSDTPSLAAQLLEVKSDKKSDETSQLGLELVENIYAANTVEGEMVLDSEWSSTPPSMSSSKSTLPPRPPTRRGRNNTDTVLSKQFGQPVLSLYQKYITNKTLPSDLTLSQLLQVLQQHGLEQGQNVVDFLLQLQPPAKDTTELTDDPDEIPDDVLLSTTTFPTALQIFASVGGLALLAEHLPLLYPEISRQITPSDVNTDTSNGGGGGSTGVADTSQDWVTVDSYPEDFYELYEPMSPAPQSSRGHSLGSNTIPPHSLVAFGLFLRLPGYAEVLLKERKKAQCLLRLVLGVTDDGDGGHILTSPLASSLPTLPFIVLKSLFDATPLTTDDGVLLRRMSLEIGALHLILACLSVLSHHAPRVSQPGFQQEAHTILTAMQAPTSTPVPTQVTYTSEEKSQQYWAKGTGFGTGSTTSSWDAEQALVRQRSEEDHVTCLLQVLASYINPGGNMPDEFDSDTYEEDERLLLPSIVPEMLSQSCLVPALSSYLRNDSVLDMARHVPLYRALLQLLRGISTCPSLVCLLLPMDKDTSGDTAAAVGELLEKMRGCVDTYASRLKSNKGKMSGSKETAGDEENEGLAMLIPDIQETAHIVHTVTQRLKQHDEGSREAGEGTGEAGIDSGRESVDQIYLTHMQKLQFGQYEMVLEEGSTLKFTIRHHYESNVKAAGDIKNPNRIRRLAQEAVTLSTSLPLSVSSSVFVRCDEERLDIMKVLITGPEDTPYANGCFEFDVYFPQDYPNAPPYINLETTGNHTVRFNPNLYNDGKVCLSVLNTWHGRPEEKWSAQTSSFLQVLVSIQSLILVCEPYFNEPGYERSRGTPSGTVSSREYDANIRQATVKWAVLEQLRNPSACFKDMVAKHFWLKRHKILRQCEEWITEMESFGNDKRTGRTIAHSTMALKKHYNQLREEFAKMAAPEGLEEIEKGDIDPKEKHYSTLEQANTSGASGSKETNTQVVPPDNNSNNVIIF